MKLNVGITVSLSVLAIVGGSTLTQLTGSDSFAQALAILIVVVFGAFHIKPYKTKKVERRFQKTKSTLEKYKQIAYPKEIFLSFSDLLLTLQLLEKLPSKQAIAILEFHYESLIVSLGDYENLIEALNTISSKPLEDKHDSLTKLTADTAASVRNTIDQLLAGSPNSVEHSMKRLQKYSQLFEN